MWSQIHCNGKRCLANFNAVKPRLVSDRQIWYHWCKNECVCLWAKLIIKLLWFSFASKLDCGSFIDSMTEFVSAKMRAFLYSMHALSPVNLAWYTTVISRLVHLKSNWVCWTRSRNWYLKLFVSQRLLSWANAWSSI